MVPFVVVDNFGKPALRPVLIGLALAAGLGSTAVALSWAVPVVLGFVVAVYAFYRLVRRAERLDPERGFTLDPESLPRWARAANSRPGQSMGSEFWRFSAPRGLAAIFGVTIFWLDTLLVGALRGPEDSAVYTAATRYCIVGTFALTAIQLAIGPMISRLTTVGGRREAQRVYRTATAWLMGLAWPIYLTMAVSAPLLLRVFGADYERGQATLTILSLSLLLSTAAGPILVVLLMAGKSTWNLANASVSVTLNVVLNLILIPRMGITGAAVAWMVSITVANIAGMLEAAFLLKLRPLGRGPLLVAAGSTLIFGVLGLATRLLFGPHLIPFLAFGVLSTALYLAFIWRFRDTLHLMELRDALKVRQRRMAARAAGVVEEAGDLPSPDTTLPGAGRPD
jgi:O-antigen/teichoic acid export membrane protein